MPVHKLIQGGEQWLPFALSRLRVLAMLAPGMGGYASQSFPMPDGATVSVRIEGDQQFLRIDGAGPRYEFFTSEPVHQVVFSTELPFEGDAYVRGSGVRANPAGKKANALFSSALTPAVGAGKTWPVRPIDDHPAPGKYPKSEQFISWAAWQNQKFFEYVNWPGNGNESMVSSTQAQAPGLNSQCNWLSPRYTAGLDNMSHMYDARHDVSPTYYDKHGSMTGDPVYEHSRVWSRHAAVQSAGGRRFFICTDNYGRFQIYPLKAYESVESPTNNYPVETYFTVTPPYPAWVTLPSLGNSNVTMNQWLWSFNKDGTRAVSCPFHSEVSGLLMAKPAGALESIQTCPVLASEVGMLAAGLDTIPGRVDTPGLVEFGIAITVTGPGELDFTVDFTLLRNSYAPDDGRFFIDAAYTLADKGDKQLMPCPEDTLVTSEVEVWVEPGNYVAGPLPASGFADSGSRPPVAEFNALRPQAFITVSANDASMAPTQILKLPALTVSASFLTADGFSRNYGPGAAGTGNTDALGDASYSSLEGSYQLARGFPIPALTTLTLQDLFPDGAVRPMNASAAGTPVVPGGEGIEWAYVHALELRTLSINYSTFSTLTGAISVRLLAYNAPIVEYSLPGQLGIKPPAPYDRAAASTQRVPLAAIPHYQRAVDFSMSTRWGDGFNIHPAGHWSHCLTTSDVLDIVSTKVGKRSKRTSHKALFNKAFGQARDYGHYASPPMPPSDGTFETYVRQQDATYGYLGGFRTNGVWITF